MDIFVKRNNHNHNAILLVNNKKKSLKYMRGRHVEMSIETNEQVKFYMNFMRSKL